MAEYGWAKPEEEQDLLDFANYVFSSSGAPVDFVKLLPLVYGQPGFADITARAMENGRIRSMISAVQADLRVFENDSLHYGFIGTVSTHPYHRGQGHMKVLMPMVMERLKQDGCQFVALAGQRQRYQHFGFEQAGEEVVLYFSASSLRHSLGSDGGEGIRFVKLAEADEAAKRLAFGLYSRRSVSTARNEKDFIQILAHNKGTGWAVYHRDQPVGYLVFGMERVSEMLLKESGLYAPAIAAWHQQLGGRGVQMLARPFELHQLPGLMDAADWWQIQNNLMIRVLDWEGFLNSLLRFRQTLFGLAPGRKVLGIAGEGNFKILVSDSQVQVTKTQELSDLSLHPLAAVQLTAHGLSRQLFPRHPFLDWFPLPLHLSSADFF